jgi:RimJ/RimL family protein N-acetyltransferase
MIFSSDQVVGYFGRMTTSPIRLRPAIVDDIPILEGINDTPESAGFEWYGFAPSGIRKTVSEGQALGAVGGSNGMLAVATEDQAIGLVSWWPQVYGPNRYPAICFGIGVVPEQRGKGYGTEAQKLLADYLFAHTNVNRVEAQTDAENLGEQRALDKAGFVREGVLRGAQYRNGEWHDIVSYGLTRAEHKVLRAVAAPSSVRTGFTA